MQLSQIKETCLYYPELEAAVHFYQHTLGLSLYHYLENKHAFFRCGPSMLLCFQAENALQKKDLPAHGSKGVQHVAFEAGSEVEYTQWKKKITETGIAIVHEQEWKNQRYSFYFHDPGGHLLEIVPPGIWD